MERIWITMDLQSCRTEIDSIDKQLLTLFEKRMDIVSQVANYKKEHQLPIFQPERERLIIQNKIAQAQEDTKEYVTSFFTNLMEISKCYQLNLLSSQPQIPFTQGTIDRDFDKIVVGCAGTKGAYAHIAASNIFSTPNIQFYQSFEQVFEAVQQQQIDYGILPIENSTAGSVTDVYDDLTQYSVYINASYDLKVEHCLAAKQQTSMDNLLGIYSHKQALHQCSGFLKQYPQIPVNLYANTALAAQFVSENEQPIAAICSEACANLFGLQVLKSQIQNSSDNYTKFIVISKQLLSNEDCDEVNICIQIPHIAGELNKLLTKFSFYHIDMNKIASRPIGDKDFNVRFFINFSGNIKDKNIQQLLYDLHTNYDYCKLLGTYTKY